MAKQLQYQSLTNIGLNGLNTQANPASLDPSYLTKAENVVIRESGRISLRKGFKQKIAPNVAAPNGVAIKSIIEHQGISASSQYQRRQKDIPKNLRNTAKYKIVYPHG